VEKHGYCAIALESSYPRGRLVNDFVLGRVAGSYEEVQQAGFSHGFGRCEGNRQLIEWMRQYNADSAHDNNLHFYGFDSPTEMTTSDSPRQLLTLVLEYLASIDRVRADEWRQRIETLLGRDADWENPEAAFTPAKSIGLSGAAIELRIETEDLISELHLRRPELVAARDAENYLETLHHATQARQLLNYHATVARESPSRIADLLGIRDCMMADNLAYIVSRERAPLEARRVTAC
jgi:erythromycin esterase-like protein